MLTFVSPAFGQRVNARNVSFEILHGGSIYVLTSVDNTGFFLSNFEFAYLELTSSSSFMGQFVFLFVFRSFINFKMKRQACEENKIIKPKISSITV